jgi:hypothetical protein
MSVKKVPFGARPKPAAVPDPAVADAFVAGGAEQPVKPPAPEPETQKHGDTTKPKLKRLTIDIDAELHLRLKTLVPRAGTTIADLARQMFTEWADEQEGKTR